MNLKEQQYVCTLARCQSLSRAAEELFISPSALSVYISNLEKYLGVRLFERTGRGKAFVLTSIGEEYVVRAEKMLELKAEFDGLVENELHKSHPAIRVGIQQRRAISVVPEALRRFMERYPDVDVIFRDGTLGDLTRMYREGNVDFMISIFRDELPDAVYQEIAMEQVLVALPDTHPAISMPIRWRATGFCIWICAIWTGRPLSFRCRIRACAGPQTISWSRPISGLGGLWRLATST